MWQVCLDLQTCTVTSQRIVLGCAGAQNGDHAFRCCEVTMSEFVCTAAKQADLQAVRCGRDRSTSPADVTSRADHHMLAKLWLRELAAESRETFCLLRFPRCFEVSFTRWLR